MTELRYTGLTKSQWATVESVLQKHPNGTPSAKDIFPLYNLWEGRDELGNQTHTRIGGKLEGVGCSTCRAKVIRFFRNNLKGANDFFAQI